jgi:uncharacterized protein YjbI with pentapeptide repeats
MADFLLCTGETISAMTGTLAKYDFRPCRFEPRELKVRGRDLTRAKLMNVVAKEADFTGATICGANFSGGEFQGARFDAVSGYNYTGLTKTRRTVFTGCDLTHAVFYHANLTHAKMITIEAEDTIFREAILNYVAFNDSQLKDADFRSATMHETDFDKCEMQGAKLDGCTVTHANFRKAGMEGGSFNNSMVADTKFKNSKMMNMSIVKTILARCKFQDADLRGTDLRGSNLWGSNLRGADLRGADLRGADLRGTNLSHMMVNDAKFAGAKMDRSTVMDHTNWLDAIDVPNDVLNRHTWEQTSPEPTPTYHSTSPVPSPSHNASNVIDLEGMSAFDVIEGDIPLRDILGNDDRVAFRYAGLFYAVSRERLLELANRLSPHNAIVYPCLALDSLAADNLAKRRPMVKLGATGIPMNYTYVPVNQVLHVANDLEHHLYDLENTGETLVSVVSRSVLKSYTHMVSGSHCQEGQGGPVYRLKRVAVTKKHKRPDTPDPSSPPSPPNASNASNASNAPKKTPKGTDARPTKRARISGGYYTHKNVTRRRLSRVKNRSKIL